LYRGVSRSNYEERLATEYPTFGEYSIPPKPQEGVDDTGVVIRSLIPISSQNARENLVSYTGPAYAFDARTACVQPDIVSVQHSPALDSGQLLLPNITDTEHYKVIAAPLHEPENAFLNMDGTNFICNFAVNLAGTDIQSCKNDGDDCEFPVWTLCNIDYQNATVGGLIPTLDFTNNASLEHSFEGDQYTGNWLASNGNISWPVRFGQAFLLINITYSRLDALVNETIHANRSTEFTYSGPWTEFWLSPAVDYDARPQKIRATLCYNAL
jgi:hypothetical protein